MPLVDCVLPQIAPLVRLQGAWVSERAAPELLPWEGESVDAVCSQIEEQVVGVFSSSLFRRK